MKNNIEITPDQATSLLDFIEFSFIDSIRNDTDCDNMDYVCNICEIYKKLKESEVGEM